MQHPSRRSFLRTAALAAPGLLGASARAERSNPPNILLIMVDDLGYGDLGCYGAPDIRTPHIDSLAEDGLRLTDFYAFPVCTPSRCALMTGRYPARSPNLEWAIHAGIDTVGLQQDQVTIAKMLKYAGYRTALFGKWHLGARPEWGPNRHGFEEFFGILSGNVDHFRHVESTGARDLFENETPIEVQGYLTDLITDRAVDFIQRQEDDPFFLFVSYNAPHWPIQGPDDEDVAIVPGQNWATGDRETYIRMVESIDDGVGRLLETLRQRGMEENTLVVFLSDNGGDRYSLNTPLSGQKGTLREGGIRIPCVLRWPGELPQGAVSSQAGILMDLSVTLMAAANVQPSRPMEGIDLMPYWSGRRAPVEQTFVWRSDMRNQKAVRWGHWKWLMEGERESLFNLERDIGESENLMDRHSDIAHWLRGIYRQWEDAMPYKQTLFGEALRNVRSPNEGAEKG